MKEFATVWNSKFWKGVPDVEEFILFLARLSYEQVTFRAWIVLKVDRKFILDINYA